MEIIITRILLRKNWLVHLLLFLKTIMGDFLPLNCYIMGNKEKANLVIFIAITIFCLLFPMAPFLSFLSSTAHRNTFIKEFHGHVVNLIRHKEASFVVEEAYANYANSNQRALLVVTLFFSHSARILWS